MSGPRPPEVSSKFRQWFVNAESGDNRSFWILRYQSKNLARRIAVAARAGKALAPSFPCSSAACAPRSKAYSQTVARIGAGDHQAGGIIRPRVVGVRGPAES